MSFTEVLKYVTSSVKGAKGAAIVGMDGIIVDSLMVTAGVDLPSVSAEYGNILKEVQNASQSLRMGSPSEVSVITESSDLIMRKINDDYFIALVMSRDGNFGKGRFLMRVAANRLVEEF
ncbi:MAG: roadblock/LC7 domain-containing protein [Nitrospirae bacterium]|nr:roadblock/LC7 domain-containing protein [Nitrospirota bacterium]MBI5694699.1 roadblock/LC7 domain-containing protein [Nitrospirota bacterium]